jgi:hypothetical protein
MRPSGELSIVRRWWLTTDDAEVWKDEVLDILSNVMREFEVARADVRKVDVFSVKVHEVDLVK